MIRDCKYLIELQHGYGTNAFKVCEIEMLSNIHVWKILVACNVSMINFDDNVNENKTQHNKNWSHTQDHPYRILIIGGSGSGKTNVLLNLIKNNQTLIKYICTQEICMKQNNNI